jgi:hypothetical protein
MSRSFADHTVGNRKKRAKRCETEITRGDTRRNWGFSISRPSTMSKIKKDPRPHTVLHRRVYGFLRDETSRVTPITVTHIQTVLSSPTSVSLPFDLQIFILHVASHLVGEETIRRALTSESNSDSSNVPSHHLCSWRSPPRLLVTDHEQRQPQQEPTGNNEECRNASCIFLEVIFDWLPTTSTETETNAATATATNTPPTITRTITMHVNALLHMSDGTGLCVGAEPTGSGNNHTETSPAAAAAVTLSDLEGHFDVLGVDVASTPETILALTFANALLMLQANADRLPTAENVSHDRPSSSSNNQALSVRVHESSDTGVKQAHIPLYYQDLQQTATWTIFQQQQQQQQTIPAPVMAMWMRSLTPTPTQIPTETETATATTPAKPSVRAEKSSPRSMDKQKEPVAVAVVDLRTLFQEWRQTPVRVAAQLAGSSYSLQLQTDQKKEPANANNDSSPHQNDNNGPDSSKKKVVLVKRKHGYSRMSKKKKTGKLSFAGAD